MEQGLVPFKDVAQVTDNRYLDTVVHGFPGLCEGMRLRDFPSFIRTTDRDDVMLNFVMDFADRLLSLPDAVLLNTFDEIERPVLDAMRAILVPPVYAIGLLHRRASIEVPAGSSLDGIGSKSNLWKEEDGSLLLEWLDGHGTRTVVYVNYGSFTVMTNEQLLEFAWGLADSGHPFMWNIRPDLVKGDAAVLPPEFLSAVSGRSMLTTWCPQEKVIAHGAVGLFLTHSGWNSTLESVCAGVPMLSWPFFAEQQTNCRYKCTEWGIGLEIGGEVKRAELAAMIGEVMEGEKGREMRRRAAEWKDEAVRATLPGGPAEANLDTVTIASRNPNDRVGIYYKTLHAFTTYREEPITVPVSLPAIYQGHKDESVWSPVMSGENVPVAAYVADAMKQDIAAGYVLLHVKLDGRVKWKVGSWVSGGYHVFVNCPALLSATGGNAGGAFAMSATAGGGGGAGKGTVSLKFTQPTYCTVDV